MYISHTHIHIYIYIYISHTCTRTHAHTHTHIYVSMCVYVCVFVEYLFSAITPESALNRKTWYYITEKKFYIPFTYWMNLVYIYIWWGEVPFHCHYSQVYNNPQHLMLYNCELFVLRMFTWSYSCSLDVVLWLEVRESSFQDVYMQIFILLFLKFSFYSTSYKISKHSFVVHWPVTEPLIKDFKDKMFQQCKQEDSDVWVYAAHASWQPEGVHVGWQQECLGIGKLHIHRHPYKIGSHGQPVGATARSWRTLRWAPPVA